MIFFVWLVNCAKSLSGSKRYNKFVLPHIRSLRIVYFIAQRHNHKLVSSFGNSASGFLPTFTPLGSMWLRFVKTLCLYLSTTRCRTRGSTMLRRWRDLYRSIRTLPRHTHSKGSLRRKLLICKLCIIIGVPSDFRVRKEPDISSLRFTSSGGASYL